MLLPETASSTCVALARESQYAYTDSNSSYWLSYSGAAPSSEWHSLCISWKINAVFAPNANTCLPTILVIGVRMGIPLFVDPENMRQMCRSTCRRGYDYTGDRRLAYAPYFYF